MFSFQLELLPLGLSRSVKWNWSVEDPQAPYAVCRDWQALTRWSHIPSRSQTRQFGVPKDAMTVQAAWDSQAPEVGLYELFVIPWKTSKAPQKKFHCFVFFRFMLFFFNICHQRFALQGPSIQQDPNNNLLFNSHNNRLGIVLKPNVLRGIYPPKGGTYPPKGLKLLYTTLLSTPCHGSSHTGINSATDLINPLSEWEMQWPWHHHYQWLATTAGCRPRSALQHSPGPAPHAQRESLCLLLPSSTDHPPVCTGCEASVVLSVVWGVEGVTCSRKSMKS